MRKLLVLAVLVLVVWLNRHRVDWRAAWSTLAGASVWLVLLTAAATFSSTLVKGVRWWLFLRRSTTLGLGHVVRLTIAGTSLNSVLVANAGDLARVMLAAREGRVTVRVVLGTLAADKITDVLAFVTIALFAFLVNPALLTSRVNGWVLGAIGATALAAMIMTRASRLAQFTAELRAHLHSGDILPAYGLSTLAWAGQVGAYTLGALAIGVRLPVVAAIHAVVAVNMAGVLRSTPGNIGIFQVMYVFALAPFGVSRASAIAAAVLIQVVQITTAVIAGAIALGTYRNAPTGAAHTT